MTKGVTKRWRKRLAVWRTRLCLYPPPEPLPCTRAFWIATGVVTLLAIVFATYFICYLTAQQDAFLTNAEDLGILDQALWNTLHGHLLQQTICNIMNDTNCGGLQGVSRFALHFEPLLLPLSLLYLLWSDPKILLIVQTLVVASGALPAFWLARLRLRSVWAGMAIALLYMLYPAQQDALAFDFHAVTLTAALLLYTLYFLYTRKTGWLLLFAFLSMACKEEIPLLIVGFGLWSLLFQHRWRTGLALLVIATCWFGVALVFLHLYSPHGEPLLLSRYSYLGSGPFSMLSTLLSHPFSLLNKHLWERAHLAYLTTLLAPSGYLPLLAPWVLLLALPTLFLNLFSSDPAMYSGQFQYSAEIVPLLIFATIEAMVLLLCVARRCLIRVPARGTRTMDANLSRPNSPRIPARGIPTMDANLSPTPGYPRGVSLPWTNEPGNHFVHGRDTPRGYPGVGLGGIGIMAITIYILFSVLSPNIAQSDLPFSQHFHWPHITAHTDLAQHVIDLIPPTASVSAQTRLVPHLSERGSIYLFPYEDDEAQFILLDVTSDSYPYMSAQAYDAEVRRVLYSGRYGIVAAEQGLLLLARGLPPPGMVSEVWSP